jgi:hypothetical protein
MRTFSSRLIVCALVCCFAAIASADRVTVVGKLEGAESMNYRDRPRIVVTILTVDGKRLQIGVENADEDKYTVDPVLVVLDQIKALNPGDMAKVVYDSYDDKTGMLYSISPYVMEPGMELPNAFVFHESRDQTEDQKSFTVVAMKRFEQDYTFVVAGTQDAAGNVTPDPDLMASIGKLKDGQLVLIDAIQGQPYPILRSIEAYTPPQIGTLKAVKFAELNGNRTTEADIEVDGKPVTVFVPGRLDGKRWIVDDKILADVRRLRLNTPVQFRVVSDDTGNSVLREIKTAPKDAPKPAGASENNK